MMDDIWESLKHMDVGEFDPYIPYATIKEQQAAWYEANKERLLKKSADYLKNNRDEINRKRREARNTEPYRSQYLAKQRERRRLAKGATI